MVATAREHFSPIIYIWRRKILAEELRNILFTVIASVIGNELGGAI